MIYKIKKQMYKESEDFAVRSEIGEVVCIIKPFLVNNAAVGYYIYNRSGEGIAQLTFEGTAAKIAIARKNGKFPGAITLEKRGPEAFGFSTNAMSKEDESYASKIKGGKTEAYSIWGKTANYSFDVYCGSKICANVVPVLGDEAVYQFKMGESGNFLVALMICLATERLNNLSTAKKR